VSGLSEKLGSINKILIVQAIVAYGFHLTHKTYLFHINNALFVKGMKVNLMPPFMMCLNGILAVNECPNFLSQNLSDNDHTIYVPETRLKIPLFLEGTVSYFNTRKPTHDELLYMNEYI